MTNLYYKPSGKFTFSGIALGLVGGLINGLILAFVYAYLIVYIPFIYLNFLLTIGFGVLLGFIVGSVMRWAKVRGAWMGSVVAFVVAAVSLYFSWAVWVSVLLGKAGLSVGALELAQQPGALWELIKSINETGAWKIFTLTVSGGFLWLVWAAEALIVLGGAVIAATGTLSTTPFCEACKSWCRQTRELMLVGEADAVELKRRMEAKDFEYLKSLGPKQAGQSEWTRVDLYECGGGHTNTLSVIHERLTVDNKGNSNKKGTNVVDNLLLSPSDILRLRQISQELGQAQASSG